MNAKSHNKGFGISIKGTPKQRKRKPVRWEMTDEEREGLEAGLAKERDRLIREGKPLFDPEWRHRKLPSQSGKGSGRHLTEDAVRQIRRNMDADATKDSLLIQETARRYNVSPSAIYNVLRIGPKEYLESEPKREEIRVFINQHRHDLHLHAVTLGRLPR